MAKKSRTFTKCIRCRFDRGPVQFTKIIKSRGETAAGLRWEGLGGIQNGGRSKTVLYILVLSITGFSPGRQAWPSMGSKSTSDHSARIYHAFQNSWRRGLA
ncbi:hypothetical protein V1505DRAFT_27210 [Lipomyces doorenjongii]